MKPCKPIPGRILKVLLVLSIPYPGHLLDTMAQQVTLPQKPNIIFIMADDMGYGDAGCYGQDSMLTPNIDRLAAEGLRFTQAYAGGPVCTPSRSVLMTGLHGGHTPARDNIPHYPSYLEEKDITIAEVLKQKGYATGGVGKWSLGDAGTVGRATNQGFDMWLGYLNQDHAHYYYTEYLDFNDSRLELSGNTWIRNNYSHDILTNGALQFIRDNADRPFFLYVAYTLPHFASPSEDEDGLTVPSTLPYENHPWPERAKKYASMIHRLDTDVGRIRKLVENLNLSGKTLIVFTSDNGGHIETWQPFRTSGSLRGFKRNLYEGGIRVPFIAWWPDHIPSGKTNTEIIAFQDMMPTFAELSGATPPERTDGISIVDALLGRPMKKKHEYLYWDYGHCRDRYDQAVRMGKWKGIRLGTGTPLELFDLERDMLEKVNVANEFPGVVQKIDTIMEKAVTPDKRYPIGTPYEGSPIWKKTFSWFSPD